MPRNRKKGYWFLALLLVVGVFVYESWEKPIWKREVTHDAAIAGFVDDGNTVVVLKKNTPEGSPSTLVHFNVESGLPLKREIIDCETEYAKLSADSQWLLIGDNNKNISLMTRQKDGRFEKVPAFSGEWGSFSNDSRSFVYFHYDEVVVINLDNLNRQEVYRVVSISRVDFFDDPDWIMATSTSLSKPYTLLIQRSTGKRVEIKPGYHKIDLKNPDYFWAMKVTPRAAPYDVQMVQVANATQAMSVFPSEIKYKKWNAWSFQLDTNGNMMIFEEFTTTRIRLQEFIENTKGLSFEFPLWLRMWLDDDMAIVRFVEVGSEKISASRILPGFPQFVRGGRSILCLQNQYKNRTVFLSLWPARAAPRLWSWIVPGLFLNIWLLRPRKAV